MLSSSPKAATLNSDGTIGGLVGTRAFGIIGPMNFTDDEIEAFRDAWQADFDELLTAEVARSELARLMQFFGTMAREFHRAPEAVGSDSSDCDTMAL